VMSLSAHFAYPVSIDKNLEGNLRGESERERAGMLMLVNDISR